MSNINTVFIDLDGVCMNMVKAAAKAHDLTLPTGNVPESFLYDTVGSKSKFWAKCHAHEFWASVEPFPWTKKLLKTLDDSNIPWAFLSKCPMGSGSLSGKAESIHRHFPKYDNKIWLVRGSKSMAASAGKLLIDDKQKNLDEWISKGGVAFSWSEITEDLTDVAEKRIIEIQNLLK